MKRSIVFTVLVAAAIAATAAVRRPGKRQGFSGARYPGFTPADFPPKLFEVESSGGLTLRGKRYPNPGRTPVILFAGFAGNGFNYDIAFEDSNFALLLARAGYDVWIANFRGTGREPYKSDGGSFDHYIQDLSACDLPAIVDAVTDCTGMKPFIFGHSMGGVVCYGYLQGATYDNEGNTVADPELSVRRNAAVRGVVSVAGPASFHFPRGNRFYWVAGSPVSRLLVRALAAAVRRACSLLRRVPIEEGVAGLYRLPPGLAYALSFPFFWFYFNPRNMTPEMLVESALSGTSDVSFRVLFQLLNGVVTREFLVSALRPDGSHGEVMHNLTRNMHLLTAPAYFIAAELDPVRPDILFRDGYSQVRSEIKGFRRVEGYGHVDLLQGLNIKEDVLPHILRFMERVLTADGHAA